MLYILIIFLIVLIRKYLHIFNPKNELYKKVEINNKSIRYKYVPYYYFYLLVLIKKPFITYFYYKDFIFRLFKKKHYLKGLQLIFYYHFQYSILISILNYNNSNNYTYQYFNKTLNKWQKISNNTIDNINTFYKFYEVFASSILEVYLDEQFNEIPKKFLKYID